MRGWAHVQAAGRNSSLGWTIPPGRFKITFMATWSDIERALIDGSIERLSTETLRSYTQVEPPASQNSAFHARFDQAMKRIRSLLEEREAQKSQSSAMEQFRLSYEQTERHHQEQIQESRRNSAAARCIAWLALAVSVGALAVSAYQTFYNSNATHPTPHLPILGATNVQASVGSKP